MVGLAGLARIGNVVQRIGAPGVLRQRSIVEIGGPCHWIDHHVFKNRGEALGGGVDFRFGIPAQTDGLGIATAFKIEDAVRSPAVFVIAKQFPSGISGKGRLAGARQAEEDGRVAARSHIGRAMHGHHTFGRKEIIEKGEDGLLHFSGIGRAPDKNDTLVDIAGDHRFGTGAVARRIGMKARQIDDGEAWNEG